jgi:microcystin-dependent protein
VATATADNATVDSPAGNLLASGANQYQPPPPTTPLHPQSVGNVGGSQAHLNMQPYLTLTFCIALQGIFPSPN